MWQVLTVVIHTRDPWGSFWSFSKHKVWTLSILGFFHIMVSDILIILLIQGKSVLLQSSRWSHHYISIFTCSKVLLYLCNEILISRQPVKTPITKSQRFKISNKNSTYLHTWPSLRSSRNVKLQRVTNATLSLLIRVLISTIYLLCWLSSKKLICAFFRRFYLRRLPPLFCRGYGWLAPCLDPADFRPPDY